MKVKHRIMTPLAPITGDQTFRELKQSLEETSTQLEELPNFIRVLAHSPAALKAYTLVDKALANGQITPRQREQIALAVAEINSCSYSLSAHYVLGQSLGLSEEEIRLARKATASDPQTKAMLRFTQAVVLQRGEISHDEFQMLRAAGFTDAQIIEILAGIGLNIFTNYFNTVAKTQTDFPLIAPDVETPCPPIKPGERK
jgi:uncharacterized peroxidase-related enzyme